MPTEYAYFYNSTNRIHFIDPDSVDEWGKSGTATTLCGESYTEVVLDTSITHTVDSVDECAVCGNCKRVAEAQEDDN